MEFFNLFGDEWDAESDRPGRNFKDARVGRRLGAERLGGSVYEVPAGEKAWPYHWHHANEELLIVLSGTPTLREPDGERVLAPGDCVLFPRGPEGAHTFWNDGAEPARVLMLSSLLTPEIVDYPDSGKRDASSPFDRALFRVEEAKVDYWEGEG